MLPVNSIQQGTPYQLYLSMHHEAQVLAYLVDFWATKNIVYLVLATLIALIVTTITPFVNEKRPSIKVLVVVLSFTAACLTAANGLFHPAATAQMFQSIGLEQQQISSQYNEDFHKLVQGSPSYEQDSLAMEDKYAAIQTTLVAKMTSVHLSFGSIGSQEITKLPVNTPSMTVSPAIGSSAIVPPQPH